MTKESVPGDGDADGEILSFYYDGLILRRVTERFFVSLLFGRSVGRSVGVGSGVEVAIVVTHLYCVVFR